MSDPSVAGGTLPATTWKEVIPDGEPARLEALAAQLHQLQKRRAGKGPVARGLHAKGKAGVLAELTVLPDLPAYARVGLFATPATFRAYVRFSNGSGTRERDTKPDVRGVAIKVLGVPGAKIIPGLEKATTQDFLLIRSPAGPFRNADEFIWFVCAAARPALLLPRALVHFGPVRAIRLIRQLVAGLKQPMASVATTRYYSALPIQFGRFAAKYALAPHAAPEPAPAGKRPPRSPDYLAEELAARLSRGPVSYYLRAQFYVDDERTPIEDPTREWLEQDAPFVTLARLTLPRQDLGAPRGQKVASFIESLSFDPWHTTADFRPLGNMMRARNAAYRMSGQERGAAPEPDGSEQFEG